MPTRVRFGMVGKELSSPQLLATLERVVLTGPVWGVRCSDVRVGFPSLTAHLHPLSITFCRYSTKCPCNTCVHLEAISFAPHAFDSLFKLALEIMCSPGILAGCFSSFFAGFLVGVLVPFLGLALDACLGLLGAGVWALTALSVCCASLAAFSAFLAAACAALLAFSALDSFLGGKGQG